jgi:hypothetical protein
MRWIELENVRRDRIAPDFRLATAGGETITRTQYRQKRILALLFLPDPASQAALAALADLAGRADQLDLAATVPYVIAPSAIPSSPIAVLADPDGSARADYIAQFPPGERPAPDAPFVVLLDRFGGPYYGGLGTLDGSATAQEIEDHIWIIAYDCPECVVPEWPASSM